MNILREIAAKTKVWRQERRRWHSANNFPNPKVFYGFDNICGRESVVAGGIIKVQDLQNFFPNCVDEPNLLYLVSSAIPSYAPQIADMAKHRGARFILNQNGVAYPAWHGDGWERTNAPLRRLIRAADHVLYQSQFCKLAADHFLGPCNGGWEVLHNSVDTEYFRPGLPFSLDPIILLQAGTHNRFYRVETAIHTLHELTNRGVRAHLVLAGKFNWKKREAEAIMEMEMLAKSLDVLHLLELRGGYTQEEAVSLFQSAHILLHTQYNDSCPRLVVEAMACGLPVVYSATGGVPELVGEEAGVGVPGPLDWEEIHPPDAILLAAAVDRIMESYAVFSAGARKRAVERFDNKAWMLRHKQIFESLLT